jgi:hypothetical protein
MSSRPVVPCGTATGSPPRLDDQAATGAELLHLLDGVVGDGEDELRGGGGFDGEEGHGGP